VPSNSDAWFLANPRWCRRPQQRMYGLVRGPDRSRLHKHTKIVTQAKPFDLSGEIDMDTDDSLRLGISLGGMAKQQKLWLIIGGGVLAAFLLASPSGSCSQSQSGGNPKGDLHAKVDPPKEESDKKAKEPEKKQPEQKQPETKQPEQKTAGDEAADDKQPETKQPEVLPAKIERRPDRVQAGQHEAAAIGKYMTPNPKEPGAFLQTKTDKPGWLTFVGKKSARVLRPAAC